MAIEQIDEQNMTDGMPHDVPPSGEELTLGKTVERLIDSGREFAQAELALAKARGAVLAGAAQWIAILGIIAFVTAFGMIVTLMIGAVLALAPLWGLGLAVLAVTGVALLAILLCGIGIKGQVSRIRKTIG